MSVKTHFIASLSPIIIPLVGVWGTITIYREYITSKKIKVRLEHLNEYESQGYTIANSTQIMNRYNSIPINQPVDYTNKEIVRPFMEKFERTLGNDVRLARQNFSTLKVEKSKEIYKTGATGTYNGTENIIKYVKNNASILGHEMLHMASYMYDSTTNTHFHGFMQQQDDKIICTGLNEGYTELMNSRLFNNGKVTAYPRLVRIVKLLEEFFPDPQILSHYYFTCNLPAFIQNLSRYCTNEELKEILSGLDRLYEYEYIHGSIKGVQIETQLASKLYTIYARNFVSEPDKVESFQQKAGENKLTAMVIAGKKMRVTRQNPFSAIKNTIRNGFTKVKNLFNRGRQPNPQPAYSR